MNERLVEMLTAENVKSYAKACIDVSDMLKILLDEGFKKLIIPSRGAYPFVNGAKNFEIIKGDYKTPFENFYFKINEWLLPFTADWGDENLDISSKNIRLFWTKVIADTFNNENSPYVNLYKSIVQEIGSYLTINTDDLLLKENSTKDDKFIFIDTCISGRAICEILEGFHQNNLNNYYIILILDNDGYSLKEKYIKILENERRKNKMCFIKVKKIFSEDASPLLNDGISSIVFPNLMNKIYSTNNEFSNNNCLGGGIWFVDSMKYLMKYNIKLNGLRGALSSYIHMGLNEYIEGAGYRFFNEYFEHDIPDLVERLGDFNIFNKSNTKILVYDRIKKENSIVKEDMVDVSSSHVIRVNFTEKYLDNFLRNLKK